MSPPLTTAADVILLGPPEGNTGGEQLDQDAHMNDSSTPTEGVLGASNIGAEPTHDKSSAVPEQTTDQQPESQPRQHQDTVMQDQKHEKEQGQQDQQDPRAQPKEQVTSAPVQQ